MLIHDLPTPCLLIDRARLMRNIERMQALANSAGVRLRPHAKTHKSVAVARLQEARGAAGLTVASVDEAETFIGAGIPDVRMAMPPASRQQFERLAALSKQARISFTVDSADGAYMASEVFAAHGARADVLLEVDTGHGRCGLRWDSPELPRLALAVATLPGLHLAGILTHAGHVYGGPGDGESPSDARQRVADEEQDRMLAAAARLRDAGIDVPGGFEISIGSTPTAWAFRSRPANGLRVTELRPGNYVYHDAQQVALGACSVDDCALTVLATVISLRRETNGRTRLFLDAGKKSITSDLGYGVRGHGILLYHAQAMRTLPHACIDGLSEEHGWVSIEGGSTLQVGDRIRFIPNHACVAVHTQDACYVVDGEHVIDLWPVDARGRRLPVPA